MKIAKTVISVTFIVGTIAIIVYDAKSSKKQTSTLKHDSSKEDTTRHRSLPK